MPYGLYVSAEGAYAQSKRLDVIANNLANVSTVGFKRELSVLQARHAEAIQQGLATPGSGSIDDIGGGILFRETKTDHSQGPVKTTNVPTDVAIRGEGFFAVQKGEETFLTRAGNFTINAASRLTTQQGYLVLSDAGAPIVIRDDSWQITDFGTVQQEGGNQNLALIKPESPGELERVGENLFRPLSDPLPVSPEQRHVAAGHLEMSSVQPTLEMTAMIHASRALEANINMMKAQDEMLAGLVQRVMRV